MFFMHDALRYNGSLFTRHPYFTLAIFDIISVLLIAAIILCASAPCAYAYVDPSVMTYTIQAVAGVAVALGAVAGVAFRRSRNAVMKILHIDADAKKTKEGNVLRIAPDDEKAHMRADKRAYDMFGNLGQQNNNANGKTSYKGLRWRARLGFSFLVCGFLFFTLLVCAPSELVQGNSNDLSFTLATIFPALFGIALLITAACAFALSAIRGRAFEIALAALFAIALCTYLQPLLLNSGLPSADGNLIAWQNYATTMLINLVIWIVLIVAIMVIHHLQPRYARLGSLAICALLIIVQGVGVISLYLDSVNNPKVTGTNNGLLEVSSKANNITFVLDTFDSSVALTLQEQYPELYAEVTSEMDGFTFYPDTTSGYIPTRFSLPYLVTGQKQKSNESWETYRAEMYQRSTYLSNISKANYSIGIYTDSLNLDSQTAKFFTENTVSHTANQTNINTLATIFQLYNCAIYRDAAWAFKPFFWFTTDEINTASTKDIPKANYDDSAYVMDDAGVYEHLITNKVRIQDDDSSYQGSYRLIHLIGSHSPYVMNEQCERVNSDMEHQTLGALRLVNEYLRQMKELGVYDSANIIITADHGYWTLTDQPITFTSCPATYVKTSRSAGQQGISQSAAQLTHGDLLATVAQSVGFDGSEYGTSVLNLNPSEQRTREFYWCLSDGFHDVGVQKYLINGYALDINNWTATNEIWPIEQ